MQGDTASLFGLLDQNLGWGMATKLRSVGHEVDSELGGVIKRESHGRMMPEGDGLQPPSPDVWVDVYCEASSLVVNMIQ